MDDLDSLLQDLQRPANNEPDSQTVNLAELDDLMGDLQAGNSQTGTSSAQAQNELDDLLNDLALGPSSDAPAPAAAPAPKPTPAPAPVAAAPAPTRAAAPAASSELDDLLNDLDAPAPKAAAPAPKPAPTPAPAPSAAAVATDDLDDLLDGLDTAASAPRPSASSGGGSSDVDSLFNDINAGARSSGVGGGGAAPRPVQPSTSGPSRGMCGGCNQAVHGEVMQSMGKLWHVNCFVCHSCQEGLGTQSFYEFEGAPHCEKCYKGIFCPRCAKCDKSITDRIISALGKKWHPDCFSCSTCNQPFPGGSFFERDGFPYCSDHFYGGSAQVCGSCNKPVTGECTNAMNKAWHPECFVCQYCRKAFVDGSFFENQGLPYCQQHYHSTTGSVCGGCQKAITGRSVNAMGKNWHPQCFVCAFCVNPLGGGNYTEKDGKCYCAECYSNLYE